MSILVVGSLNMDLVTYVNRVPKGGETINGITFNQYCGEKVLIKRLQLED